MIAEAEKNIFRNDNERTFDYLRYCTFLISLR